MTNLDAHDAIFHRGIKLLNSSAEGSEEKLRSLLEESIKQKYGNSRSLNLRKEYNTKKESGGKNGNGMLGKKESPKKYTEKRHGDKNIDERSDGNREGSSSRKSHDHKANPYKSPSSNPSSPRSVGMGLAQSVSMSLLRDLDTGKESVRCDDDEDLALEILEEDLTCVICRGMDVGVRNQLVECLECHSLYHQECHQPPVPDTMNEPRSAWYCSSCLKAMSKVTGSGSLAGNRMPAVNIPSVSTKSQPLNSKSGSGGSPKVFGGFPVSVKSHSSSKSSSCKSTPVSNPGSSKLIVQKINMVSADKRLAIMKKKAAKMQEKRKLTK